MKKLILLNIVLISTALYLKYSSLSNSELTETQLFLKLIGL